MTISSGFTVTDMFAGAGGSTTGATLAGAEVTLALNHNAQAIETHNTNYPGIEHVLTDLLITNPRRYKSTLGLMASPECTHQSLAAGKTRKNQGMMSLWDQRRTPDSAEERSRCTMWTPLDWAEYHNYQFVVLENVVEARHWRPFKEWLQVWGSLEYETELVYLNSMFALPTPQSRDRMYLVAWKKGNRKPDLKITPLAWCVKCEKDCLSVQSWKDPLRPWGKYRQQYVYRCPECAREVLPYYYAAAHAIDWTRPAPRIGDRKKPLKAKTRKRIEIGLKKHQGEAPFTFSLNHDPRRSSNVFADPLGTQTTYDDRALTIPQPFLIDHLGTTEGYRDRDINRYLSTLCASGNHQSVVMPPYMVGEQHPSWLMTYYNHGQMASTQSDPMPTATTKDRHALITTKEFPCSVDECGFRMLTPEEIKAGMAFPKNYVITGSRRDQVKQLGNAVTPPAMKLLVERCKASLA